VNDLWTPISVHRLLFTKLHFPDPRFALPLHRSLFSSLSVISLVTPAPAAYIMGSITPRHTGGISEKVAIPSATGDNPLVSSMNSKKRHLISTVPRNDSDNEGDGEPLQPRKSRRISPRKQDGMWPESHFVGTPLFPSGFKASSAFKFITLANMNVIMPRLQPSGLSRIRCCSTL
jgi:hypothetical protein